MSRTNLLAPILMCLLPYMASAQTQAIGYGSSTSVITEKIQEGFLSGFQVGFKSIYPSNEFNQFVKLEEVHDGSALGSQVAARRLITNKVSALFGFPGSTDALLAGQIAKESNMIAVFPGCNHNGLANLGENVFSTGHSGTDEAWAGLEFGTKFLKFRKVLVIINPMAAPSVGLEPIFNSPETKAKFGSMEISLVRLEQDLLLPTETIAKIKNGQYDYLFLTPYPEASKKFTDQLVSEKLDLPIVAGSAWGTVDSDVMRRFVANKKAPFYLMTSWNPESASSKVFRKIFKKVYAKEPTAESAYGYDLGVIAATVLKRTATPVTVESYKKAFHSNLCFSGLSIGSICFPVTGGHAKRSIHFLKFTRSGFAPIFERKP